MTSAPPRPPRPAPAPAAPPAPASPAVSRRSLLLAGGLTGALAAVGLPGAWAAAPRAGYPFALGVASGDPRAASVVIWTRLAPDPLAGGGMPSRPVSVEWQVAGDERFRSVVRQGVATALPAAAHSLHVEVDGLEAGRWYWYRFRSGGDVSPVGRTRTMPVTTSLPSRLRFAFASCQHYEHGWFTAYRHLAREDLDLVVHLGDYIYESGRARRPAPSGNVRSHVAPETEIVTLGDYRNRHALYRLDPDLQAAHAAFPWLVVPDDHEVDNNWADEVPEKDQPREPFLRRRAAGFQAYWEHLPLRARSRPRGIDMRLYRGARFGRLAKFCLLDTRQYRDDQPCGGISPADCAERSSRDRTILGDEQEAWLFARLAASSARWNVLANQVYLAQLHYTDKGRQGYNTDAWDGYVDSRDRLLRFLEREQVRNPMVVTGDWHAHWLADLKADFADPRSPVVGTELVGTSISSDGNGSVSAPYGEQALRDNTHVRFFNSQRGYVRCDVTPARWRTDFRVVPYVDRPGAPIGTAATYVNEDGRRAQRA